MMSNVGNTADTINAAATAIISAESRVQPSTSQKRRWRSWWNLYWCFGLPKGSKQIGHAVVTPGAVASRPAVQITENSTYSTSIVLPFVAPPSSPASFLQPDTPSSTAKSPSELPSLTSLSANSFSPRGPASIFAIGPYTYETQPVTPPTAFSAFTTEPSTAPLTPPPESVQFTTPSSPEVPFARMLTSSLEHARRNSGTNKKFPLSHYEFYSYQMNPESPSGTLVSPGSAISYSGTSSPYPSNFSALQFQAGQAPRLLNLEQFSTGRWGSRLDSGSLTPVGQDSRMNSGSVTPHNMGFNSRMSSGSLTPDGVSRDGFLLESQISEIVSRSNVESGPKTNEASFDHRVSFELTGEDVARCLASKSSVSNRSALDSLRERIEEEDSKMEGEVSGETESEKKCTTNIKEFNFDNRKGDITDKASLGPEWWANESVAKREANWTFFPRLQPEVSGH